MRATVFAFFFVLVFPQVGRAVQPGTIEIDGSELREGPGMNYKVLQTLPKGTRLDASSLPRDGYYKVRTKAGKVGWIAEADLSLPSKASSAPRSPRGSVKQPSGTQSEKLDFRLLGDFDLFNMKEANDLIQFQDLANGISFGGEIGYRFTPLITALIRVERITKSVSAVNSAGTKNYVFDASSMPVMAGAEIALVRKKNFVIDFSLLAGLALGTSLQLTSKDDPSPNITKMGESPLTALGKLDARLFFSKNFGIFVEGGYRYLTTSKLVPTTSGNGDGIFRSSGATTGPYQPISLNFSGLVIGGGVEAVF